MNELMQVDWGKMAGVVTTYGPWIVTIASAAASALPRGSQGTWWAAIRGIVEVLAVNFGHAKNPPK